jgi:hypothetical protein
MFGTVSSKNNQIFVSSHIHFIILLLTLFTLLFLFTTACFWDEIFIALQRKFVVPQIEKKFGFRGKSEKIKYGGNYEYETFYIESVEEGSLFSQAGFKAGDVPRFYVCRFFVNGKTDEAMFYSQLYSMREASVAVFSMSDIDDFRRRLKGNDAVLPVRKVFLTTRFTECFTPQ